MVILDILLAAVLLHKLLPADFTKSNAGISEKYLQDL